MVFRSYALYLHMTVRENLDLNLRLSRLAPSRIRPPPFATWLGPSIHANPGTRAAMVARRRAFLQAELERERASHLYVQHLGTERARVGVHVIALASLRAELDWLDTL